jgi:hypothetical protein
MINHHDQLQVLFRTGQLSAKLELMLSPNSFQCSKCDLAVRSTAPLFWGWGSGAPPGLAMRTTGRPVHASANN